MGNGVVMSVIEALLEKRVVAERFEVLEDVNVADVEDVDEVDRAHRVQKRETGFQLEVVHLQRRLELVHTVDPVHRVDDLFVHHRVWKETDDFLRGVAAKWNVEVVRLQVTREKRNNKRHLLLIAWSWYHWEEKKSCEGI